MAKIQAMPTFEEVDTDGEAVNATAAPVVGDTTAAPAPADTTCGERVRFSPRSDHTDTLTSQRMPIAAGREGTVICRFSCLPPLVRVNFDDVAPGDWADVYLHELSLVAADEATHDPTHGPQQWHPESW